MTKQRRQRNVGRLRESDERALNRFWQREQARIKGNRPIGGSCRRVQRRGDTPAEGPDL